MKGNIWGIGMKGVKLSKRNKKNLKRGVYQFSSRVMEIHLGDRNSKTMSQTFGATKLSNDEKGATKGTKMVKKGQFRSP